MADVPAAPAAESPSVESRLSSFFSNPPPAKPEPVIGPYGPIDTTPDVSPEVAAEGEQPPEGEPAPVEESPAEEPAEPISELEHLGKKYTVPESLAKAFEENRAMATRVTQQTAELKRQLDTREQALSIRQQFEQASASDLKEVQRLEAAIDQTDSWLAANFRNLDTKQILDTKQELDIANKELAKKREALNGKFKEFTQKQGQLREEAIAKGVEYLRRSIPSFSEKHSTEIMNYAVSNGYAKDEIAQALDPRVLRDLWKASQWDALQASKGAAVQRGSAAPPAVKPSGAAAQDATATRRYQEDRARLKKSGDLKDAAALLMRLK